METVNYHAHSSQPIAHALTFYRACELTNCVANELSGVLRFFAAPNFTWWRVPDLLDVPQLK
jgi:hypothetical protein